MRIIVSDNIRIRISGTICDWEGKKQGKEGKSERSRGAGIEVVGKLYAEMKITHERAL